MQYRLTLKKSLRMVLFALVLIVSVTCAQGIESKAASKLKVSPNSKTVYIGNKVTLKANQKVKWSIVNKKTNVKIVSKSSKKVTIKGMKAGTVYVKAKAGKKAIKVKIVVKKNAPSKINLVSSSPIVGVGNHCAVYVKSVEPANASKDVSFLSSDEGIATIDQDGFVTGVEAGTVTITAKSKVDGKKRGSIVLTVVHTKKGVVTMTVSLSDEAKYPQGKVAQIWIPVPQTGDNQVAPASVVKWNAASATKAELTTDSLGNRVVYLMWDENVKPADRTATISFHISRQEIVCPSELELKEHGSVDVASMEKHLKATKRTGSLSSGIVKDTADQIVNETDANTVYQKAYAIYEWVCQNLMIANRKPTIGSGDVAYILNHLDERVQGSLDVNAVFVALCKAENIPARCVFGLNLNALQNADAQQCIAQFYLPGYGWVDVDACSVIRKIKNSEDLYRGEEAVYADKWNQMKEDSWGNTSESWFQLSEGLDLKLFPMQNGGAVVDADHTVFNEDGTLNYFVYPYAEYDGQYVRCYPLSTGEKSELKYSYSFEQDVDDCGCD